MAFTLRLPEPVMARAQGYAKQLGLSLNGLIAVALVDYLDARARGTATVHDQAAAMVHDQEADLESPVRKAAAPKRSNPSTASELRRLSLERWNQEVERKKLEKAEAKGA